MELLQMADGAVAPWNSTEAESGFFERLPQQEIDVCLFCLHQAEYCDNCNDWTRGKEKPGRPKKEIDRELLRKMMRLRRCNKEMCAALGISVGTLSKYKKEIKIEEESN